MRFEIKQGDWLDVLRTMPDESVQCCVTSPPYWGLRDYGTAKWVGGDPDCDHLAGRGGHLKDSVYSIRGGANKVEESQRTPFRDTCGKCGATRVDRQLGLERTPEEYVAKMVEGFREVRRVLRKNGTCWINLGDSYNAGTSSARSNHFTKNPNDTRAKQFAERSSGRIRVDIENLKPKDLVGIPWMVAFALRANGWYLRQDIVWSKPNPMPESVTDRCTKAHEYLFLLSKSERYFYDAEAIKEPVKEASLERSKYRGADGTKWHDSKEKRGGGVNDRACLALGPMASESGRNKRSVWEIATSPFPEAHFATFPPKLVEPCILAGSKSGDTVLDPFNGAGTTGLVATRLGRNYVGIELNPEYVAMAERRIQKDMPLLNQMSFLPRP